MKIQEAYQSVKDFNEIAGTLENVDDESIALQLDLMQEEYLETVDAFDEGNKVELLDGACDMFVIACGFLAKLEAQGYDVEKALTKVTENNMSKFISIQDKNIVWSEAYQEMYNSKHQVIVLRNKAGKIMKRPGFVSVDLSDCVPVPEWRKGYYQTNEISEGSA